PGTSHPAEIRVTFGNQLPEIARWERRPKLWNRPRGVCGADAGELHTRSRPRETVVQAESHAKIGRAIAPAVSHRACARLVRSPPRAPEAALIFPPQTLRQIVQSCSRVSVRRARVWVLNASVHASRSEAATAHGP